MIYFTGPVTNANELIKIILNGIIDEVSSAWWCFIIADEATFISLKIVAALVSLTSIRPNVSSWTSQLLLTHRKVTDTGFITAPKQPLFLRK